MAELTHEAMKAIDEYMWAKLKVWGAVAGIVNVAALL